MPIHVTMPALSPTMEEGALVKWLIKEGDIVHPGDVIAEIETDKATMEVEAVDEGVVAKILVEAGTEHVKVNTIIAVLASDGEDVSSIVTQFSIQALNTEQVSLTSSKEKVSLDSAVEVVAETRKASFPDSTKEAFLEESRFFSSPLARRLAHQAGLNLKTIQGSGPRGRIVKSDIEKAIAQKAASPSSSFANSLCLEPERIPHDSIRKTIARRLTESKTTIPHFYLKQECRIDRLLSLRTELNASSSNSNGSALEEKKWKISVNDMVIRSMALALRDVPSANVVWTPDNLLLYKHSDIAVAVSIPGGILTPVIRQAELKSLLFISEEMKNLITRARERKLKPEEFQGGTASISNLGMFGVDEFSGIINPPQTLILAVGAGKEKAFVDKGQIVAAFAMTVTLSVDHRALDGAVAAELLQAFRHYIENPIEILL